MLYTDRIKMLENKIADIESSIDIEEKKHKYNADLIYSLRKDRSLLLAELSIFKRMAIEDGYGHQRSDDN